MLPALLLAPNASKGASLRWISVWVFMQALSFFSGSCSNVQTELEEGDRRYSSQEYTAALAHYAAALEYDSQSPMIYNKRAAAYLGLRKHSQAIRDLNKALEIDAGYLQGLTQRGKAYFEICQFSKAEKDWSKVISLKPGHKTATAELGKISEARKHLESGKEVFDAGDYAKAREHLNLVFSAARDCLPARLLEARIFMKDKEYEQAIAQTGRLLKSDGSNLEALHIRGVAHIFLYDFDMAKKHFGEILRFDPDHKAAKDSFAQVKKFERKQRAADGALESRNWKEAGELYSEALAMDDQPEEFKHQMLWGLCQSQYNQHVYDAAAETCELVLHYSPENEGAQDLRIRSLMENEEFDQAVQEAQQAAEKYSNSNKFRNLLFETKKRLKMSKRKDYYKILEVDRSADAAAIKKAYRTAAKLHHPDRAEGDKKVAEDKFRQIAEAYEVLSDPETKMRYDNGEDLEDINSGNGGDFFHQYSGGQAYTFTFH